MMKKECLFIFLFLISISFSSAATCSIVEADACTSPDYKLMYLSDTNNAHGRILSEEYDGSYNYVLCCDFGRGNTNCLGDNKITSLSDVTNAHAEIPSLDNYDEHICYSTLDCTSGEGLACNNEKDIKLISLSNTTDAHIGVYDAHPIKICCQRKVHSFWSDKDGKLINYIDIALDKTKIYLSMINSDLSSGESITFKIYERDPVESDLIKSIESYVDYNGDSEAEWIITREDLENGLELGEGNLEDLDGFYFEIEDSEGLLITSSSGELNINIKHEEDFCLSKTYCQSYENSTNCEADLCETGLNTVERDFEVYSCGETEIGPNCINETKCGCYWNEETEKCESYYDMESDCTISGGKLQGGICKSETTGEGDCSIDSFIKYAVQGDWTWIDPLNQNPEYLQEKNKCETEREKTVPCPSQVKLPFFSYLSIIIAISGIFMIYFLMLKRRTYLKHL